jgi:predicted nucleotidyltransferase
VRRADAIAFFASHREDLRRLGISSLLLIAEFDHPVGYLGLARVQHELERLLGCTIDLATPGMIRPEFRDRIYGEAVRAA